MIFWNSLTILYCQVRRMSWQIKIYIATCILNLTIFNVIQDIAFPSDYFLKSLNIKIGISGSQKLS